MNVSKEEEINHYIDSVKRYSPHIAIYTLAESLVVKDMIIKNEVQRRTALETQVNDLGRRLNRFDDYYRSLLNDMGN